MSQGADHWPSRLIVKINPLPVYLNLYFRYRLINAQAVQVEKWGGTCTVFRLTGS
jgi:hypothetical protein